MPLPGGLWHQGEVQRYYAFRPLTGAVELAVAEAAWECGSLPTAVTKALAASLENLAGMPPEPDMVDDLSIGDRQFLMQQLAIVLGMDGMWMTAVCRDCDKKFDFLMRFSELLVKAAGPTYPFALVDTSQGRSRWRVPTGSDQQYLATLPAEADSFRHLALRCLVDHPASNPDAGPARWLASLTDADLAQVEASLETVAPEVTSKVLAACPECGQTHTVDIDPYVCLSRRQEDILGQVHTIAAVYHWSEGDILALPQWRRQRYLRLIDRSRGLTS